VSLLNELECVRGEIYANIWYEDTIAKIDPASGNVTGRIDLAGLRAYLDPGQPEVLNGIAYDAESDRLFVTGKLWPNLFEIDLVASD
jgi:glutamine cyclotransferase